jgi:hypothetical protein
MAADAATTGAVRVEKVRGRSTLTRCFARYPLKLIAPSKVGPASCDAVWLYALTYGGGIVSVSPSLSCPAAPSCFLALTDRFPACCASPWHARGTPSLVRSASAIDGCTAAITTQASTKVCFFCFCQWLSALLNKFQFQAVVYLRATPSWSACLFNSLDFCTKFHHQIGQPKY